MNSYNGYTGPEREVKLRALHRLRRAGAAPVPPERCMLCGDADPTSDLEPHSEDYSQPFLWTAPAMYWLCFHCHRVKLHKRFTRPHVWRAFLMHVRRGGYARELKAAEITSEFRDAIKALEDGKMPTFRVLRDREFDADPWWEQLTVDPGSLDSPESRPRR